MGNNLSKNRKNYNRLQESIWGYGGAPSTIEGLFFSSFEHNGKFNTTLFLQKGDCYRTVVWFKQTSVQPTGLNVFLDDTTGCGGLRIVFTIGEEDVAEIEPVVWKQGDFKLNDKQKLVELKKKNEKSSGSQYASVNFSDRGFVLSHECSISEQTVALPPDIKNGQPFFAVPPMTKELLTQEVQRILCHWNDEKDASNKQKLKTYLKELVKALKHCDRNLNEK